MGNWKEYCKPFEIGATPYFFQTPSPPPPAKLLVEEGEDGDSAVESDKGGSVVLVNLNCLPDDNDAMQFVTDKLFFSGACRNVLKTCK